MKKSCVFFFILIIQAKLIFSQIGGYDVITTKRRILNVNSTLINTKSSNHLFNNIEMIINPLLFLKLKKYRFGLGLGFGTYFAHYTGNGLIYYPKINIDYNLLKPENISIENFYEYYLQKHHYNTGVYAKYSHIFYKDNSLAFELEIKPGISYNSMFDKLLLNFGVGININQFEEKTVYYRKPVLYFYPEDTLSIAVILNFNGKLTFTWPKYTGVWHLKVFPNSKIINLDDHKKYDYLFWEGDYTKPDKDTISTGFIVFQNNLSEFLVNKLEYIGLNDREINDFITYWVPLLRKPKYLIHFTQNDNCNKIAQYKFSKKPDTFIRLTVIFISTDKNHIKSQKLTKNKRRGFTITEWAGIEL